jgi:hypothetical protein
MNLTPKLIQYCYKAILLKVVVTGEVELAAVVAVAVLWVVSFCGLLVHSNHHNNLFEEKLLRICEQETLKYRNLSFHLKEYLLHTNDNAEKLWCIEIHVCPWSSSATSSGLMEQELPMAVASASVDMQLSPMERLEQLDKDESDLVVVGV